MARDCSFGATPEPRVVCSIKWGHLVDSSRRDMVIGAFKVPRLNSAFKTVITFYFAGKHERGDAR